MRAKYKETRKFISAALSDKHQIMELMHRPASASGSTIPHLTMQIKGRDIAVRTNNQVTGIGHARCSSPSKYPACFFPLKFFLAFWTAQNAPHGSSNTGIFTSGDEYVHMTKTLD
jgi:hypothetical protein